MDRKRPENPQHKVKSEEIRDSVTEVISIDDYDEKMKLIEVQGDIQSFREDITQRISQVEDLVVNVGQTMLEQIRELKG